MTRCDQEFATERRPADVAARMCAAGATVCVPVPDDHQNGVLVVIPAWNEQAAFPGVLAELGGVAENYGILVVNDGSANNTGIVARRAGVTVLDLPINLGVGGTMRAGYKHARRLDYDVVVQLDADGSTIRGRSPCCSTRWRRPESTS